MNASNLRLELRKAAFGHGRQRVLRDLSLTLRPGVLTAVLGNNGSGKSTLIKGLVGLATQQTGEVLLEGESLRALDRPARARRLAYLEQQADCHWPLTVQRVVALGRYPRGPHQWDARDDACVTRAMAITDTAGMATRPIRQLSGGERARVLLARALAVDAPVLLADEPVAGLDPCHQHSVLGQLRQWADEGRIVGVVLHDLNLALRYCEDAVLIQDGTAEHGATRTLLQPATIERVFGVRAALVSVDGQPALVHWPRES